ncbi:MAG TPA: helix-turn-helix domain-containing protein, partial [Patescibacteria group bacterium]|nr:helix-turn-helix domain-containing protein [Patescibacteria group bacterium]
MLYSEAKKEKIVLDVLQDRKSVTEASKKYIIARKTIYAWIKRYKKGSLKTKFVKGKRHPASVYPKAYSYINRWIVANPSWGCRILSSKLKEKGILLSFFSINRLLKDMGGETYDRRVNYARNFAGPGRSKEDVRLEIVRKALNQNESISSLSEKYKIARKTIYKWIKKYQVKGNLTDSYVVAEAHPRAIYPKITKEVLNIVVANPNYSVHTIAKFVKGSSWTIWSILNRNNLNTQNLRFAYSQNIQSTKEKVATTGIEGRVKSVFETFVPNLAPAPPPGKFSFLKIVGITSVLTVITSLAFSYWISIITSTSSFGGSVGMVFASLALIMGMFFFLYSLKYYITLAIVLSYSQKEGLENEGAIKSKGLLQWLLGAKASEPERSAVGLKSNLDSLKLESHPFVSVQIALYNEKNVVERLAKAVTSFEYDNYEVILADDSTDETSEKIRQYQEKYLFKGETLKETKGD